MSTRLAAQPLLTSTEITKKTKLMMCGADTVTASLFSMHRMDDFVQAQHPLRPIRDMVNHALKEIEPLLPGMYSVDV